MGGKIKLYAVNERQLTEKQVFNAGSRILVVDTTESGEFLVVAGNRMPVLIYENDGNSFHLAHNLTSNGVVVRSVSISDNGGVVAFADNMRCLFIYRKAGSTYDFLQKECPKDPKPNKCYLTKDAKYLFGFSSIGDTIYVYQSKEDQKYVLAQTIKNETFKEGVNFLLADDDLAHLVVALADNLDGIIHE